MQRQPLVASDAALSNGGACDIMLHANALTAVTPPIAIDLDALDALSASEIVSLSPSDRTALLREAIASKSDHLYEDILPHLVAGFTSLSLRHSRVSDRGLGLVSTSCGAKLLDIDLSFCTRLRDAGAIELTRACPLLEKLVLSHCRLTDAAFEAVARGCRALRELDCAWNGSGVTERSVRAFAAHLHQLETLAICGCRVGDDALLALACACQQLSYVNTRGCDLLSEAGVVAALCTMPKVASLELCQLPRVSEPSLQLLVSRTRQVRRLDVSMCQRLGDESIANAASGLSQLRSLECYGVGRLQCPNIASPTLTNLILSGCRALSRPALHLPNLERLEMHSCKELDPSVLGELSAASPLLAHLDLSGCSRLSVLRLGDAPSLSTLILDGCAMLREVSLTAARLARLSMRGCNGCPQAVIEGLCAASPALVSLDLRGCKQLSQSLACAAPNLADLRMHWRSNMPSRQASPLEPPQQQGQEQGQEHQQQGKPAAAGAAAEDEKMRFACRDSNGGSSANASAPTVCCAVGGGAAAAAAAASTAADGQAQQQEEEEEERLLQPRASAASSISSSSTAAAFTAAPAASPPADAAVPGDSSSSATTSGPHSPLDSSAAASATGTPRATVSTAAAGHGWDDATERSADTRGALPALVPSRSLFISSLEVLAENDVLSAVTSAAPPAAPPAAPDAAPDTAPPLVAASSSDAPAGETSSDGAAVVPRDWSGLESLSIAGCAVHPLGWSRFSAVLGRACGGALRSLELHRCEGLTDALLHVLLPGLPRLTSLLLSRLKTCSPKIVSANLTSLSLRECEELTSPRINCPKLVNLELSGSDKLVAPSIASAALRALDLSGCRQLTDPQLACPALTSLDLSTCTALEAAKVQACLDACSAVRVLRLSGCRGLSALELSSSSLRALHICWCTRLSRVSLQTPKLHSLFAYGCAKLSETYVDSKLLVTAELQKCGNADDRLLSALTGVGGGGSGGDGGGGSVGGSGGSSNGGSGGSSGGGVTPGSRLELLNLTDCKTLVAPRLTCARLRTLHLYNCLQLSSLVLFCPALELLNLTHCVALERLSLATPKLATLLCAGCKRLPDDAVAAVLRTCGGLKTIDLKGCPLLKDGTREAARATAARRHDEQQQQQQQPGAEDAHEDGSKDVTVDEQRSKRPRA